LTSPGKLQEASKKPARSEQAEQEAGKKAGQERQEKDARLTGPAERRRSRRILVRKFWNSPVEVGDG
jgi:hypothetical protein